MHAYAPAHAPCTTSRYDPNPDKFEALPKAPSKALAYGAQVRHGWCEVTLIGGGVVCTRLVDSDSLTGLGAGGRPVGGRGHDLDDQRGQGATAPTPTHAHAHAHARTRTRTHTRTPQVARIRLVNSYDSESLDWANQLAVGQKIAKTIDILTLCGQIQHRAAGHIRMAHVACTSSSPRPGRHPGAPGCSHP